GEKSGAGKSQKGCHQEGKHETGSKEGGEKSAQESCQDREGKEEKIKSGLANQRGLFISFRQAPA
ncbi:MAG TPA: hypothetical protein VD816_12450, partial [Ohtaekwangia sp.]|nr:hypothetical protein [Ohtaekwangia sp.]